MSGNWLEVANQDCYQMALWKAAEHPILLTSLPGLLAIPFSFGPSMLCLGWALVVCKEPKNCTGSCQEGSGVWICIFNRKRSILAGMAGSQDLSIHLCKGMRFICDNGWRGADPWVEIRDKHIQNCTLECFRSLECISDQQLHIPLPLADKSCFSLGCRLLALFATVFISTLALVSKACMCVSKLVLYLCSMLQFFPVSPQVTAFLPSNNSANGLSSLFASAFQLLNLFLFFYYAKSFAFP